VSAADENLTVLYDNEFVLFVLFGLVRIQVTEKFKESTRLILLK